MIRIAAVVIASTLVAPHPEESRRRLDQPLPVTVARLIARHHSGDLLVKTVGPDEKPGARLEVVASGAGGDAERRFLDLVRLSVETKDDAITVRSLLPETEATSPKLSFNATLTLLLPETCAVDLENRFGKVEVGGLHGDVKVVNRLAPVEVGRVRGNVTIEDLMSSIVVHDVEGDLLVNAGNCSVAAESVSGLAKIKTSALAVSVRHSGSADVETSMQSVELKTIAHDAKAVAPRCSVVATGIGGNLSISSSHNPVRVADVDGDLAIDQKYGTIDVTRVKGKATIAGSLSDTTLTEVGSADVRCPLSVVRLNRVGNLVGENSGRTLAIVDPLGDVQATATGGRLELSAAKLPAGEAAHELTLVANGGAIELSLPDDGSYALDATSTVGQIECQLPGMDITLQGTARVGSLRRGDGKAKLHATCVGGAIRVVPAGSK